MYKQFRGEVEEWKRSSVPLCVSLLYMYIEERLRNDYHVRDSLSLSVCRTFLCLHSVSACSLFSRQMLENICTNVTQINCSCFTAPAA